MTIATLGTWRNPPLAYVVAELVISPHYSMASAMPELQDALRNSYPRTIEATEFSITPPSGLTPMPAWQLLAADQSRGLQFSSRAIALHSTSYGDSKAFLASWREVLAAIEASKLGVFVERAGLRYIDLIAPQSNRSTREYISTALQGISPPKGAEIQHHMALSSFLIEGVAVQVRTATPSPANTLWPPNFNPLPLKKSGILIKAEKLLASSQEIGFIDTDCLADVQSVFDVSRLGDLYTSLHAKMSETFKLLISDYALEEWK